MAPVAAESVGNQVPSTIVKLDMDGSTVTPPTSNSQSGRRAPNSRSPVGFRPGPIVAFFTLFGLLALAATACGDSSDGGGDGIVADGVADGEGLRVQLSGTVDGTTLCPGNTRPCVTLDGDLSLDGNPVPPSEPVRVIGTLADGVLTVESVESVPSILDWLADHCDDKKTESEFLDVAATSPEESGVEEGGELEDYDQLGLYQLSIPDSYAMRWLSPRQVIHLGVVGDPEPHREALDELGIGEFVCVVGGFERTDAELATIQDEVVELLESWPDAGNWGAGRDAHLGAVSVDLHRADEAMIAEAAEQFGDGVILNASILVLNGTLVDYDAAAVGAQTDDDGDDGPTPDSIGLVASCGPVTFPSIPPDPDGFDPVDDEILAILDEFATGPLSVESADFVPAYEWSVAERTDARIVLFGQSDQGAFADIVFEQRDGLWQAGGWGGCNIIVEAPGLGSATTILDPEREPDPDSSELPVLIMERNCASGQAPVDREVLPVVIETDTTIEIVTLVEPVTGGADCQGNPWHPITVTLRQPLGDRTIFDGQSPPPVERTWPPSDADLGG